MTRPKGSKNKPKQKVQSKGIGDTIEKALEATGVAKVAKAVLGDDCGCEERKKKLNKLFPYRKVGELTDQDIDFLKNWFSLNTSRVKSEEQKEMLSIYNRIFRKKENPSTCSSCVKRIVTELKTVYDTYEQ